MQFKATQYGHPCLICWGLHFTKESALQDHIVTQLYVDWSLLTQMIAKGWKERPNTAFDMGPYSESIYN